MNSLLYSVPNSGRLVASVGLAAVVRKTVSPATIGDDQPEPGTSTLHSTFSVVDHRTGNRSSSETGMPAGPRKPGHVATDPDSAADCATAATGKAISATKAPAHWVRRRPRRLPPQAAGKTRRP